MASTHVTYSALGQILHNQLPELPEPPTAFAYDPVGNLTTMTNPLGHLSTSFWHLQEQGVFIFLIRL